MTHWRPEPDLVDSGTSWLGHVPRGWVVAPVGRFARFHNGFDYSDIEVSEGGFPVYGSGGEFRRATRYLHDGESVLFGRKGTIDKPLYVEGKFWTVDTMYYTSFDGRLLPKFAYYWAQTLPFGRWLTNTALPSMTQSDLKQIQIAVPSPVEQEAVVAYLDRETAEIDAFIADQEKLIDLLTERRSASVRAKVTMGIDSNAQVGPSGVSWIGELPKGWTVRKLASVARIGNGSTPSRENPAYWSDGHIPWLSSGAVNQDLITTASDFVTSTAVSERHLPWVLAGSLVVGLTGQGKTRGTVAQLAIPTTVSQHLAYVSPHANLEGRFGYWALTAAYEELRLLSDGNGGTKGGLTCEDLGSLQIPLPGSEEQIEISAVLDSATAEMNATIADAREAIALSKERRAALISAAVTGKIDVREHVKVDA